MESEQKIKGTLALLKSLQQEGVDTIFGYPGGAIMPFYDELYGYRDQFRHILVRHEQGAVHAAQGYARTSGKTGVCVATAGPGATNFITGIADAMLDSTPIVCITAQVNKENLGTCFFQEADMINITLPITKWSYQITSAEEIPSIIAKAFHIASSGRPGPVVISLTRNAQVELMNFHYNKAEFISELNQPCLTTPTKASTMEIAQALEMLSGAKKPLIIAGHGVSIAGAEKALIEFAEKTGIPVATTLLGLSVIPTNHPQWVGNVGMHGHLAPNRMTQEADVIMAVGMRFSDRVTGNLAGYAPKAKIIHVEIDPAEVDKNVKIDLPIIGDARVVLEALNACGLQRKEYADWYAFAASQSSQEASTVEYADLCPSKMVKMGQVVKAVSDNCSESPVVVSDVGQNQMFAARYSHFGPSSKWVTSGGLGTMGFGLPAAIGAKVAAPEKEVIVFLGDGGFQMNIQELGTIMQENLPVKIVLLNNTYLGMVRQWQELFFGQRYSFTYMKNPDFKALLGAYGIPAFRVTAPSELDGAVKQLLSVEGPAFLEVATAPEENIFPMVPAGYTLDNVALKREDL